jgi:hypothetical protein
VLLDCLLASLSESAAYFWCSSSKHMRTNYPDILSPTQTLKGPIERVVPVDCEIGPVALKRPAAGEGLLL